MREIKFRAWDKRQKALYRNWQRGSLVASVLSQKLAYTPTRNDQFKPDVKDMKNFVFMQYTGLKDKNGVEIYEGDIVRRGPEMPPNLPRELQNIHPIVFESGCFVCAEMKGIALGDGWGVKFVAGAYEGELEVIGNIYENPDLLTPTNT